MCVFVLLCVRHRETVCVAVYVCAIHCVCVCAVHCVCADLCVCTVWGRGGGTLYIVCVCVHKYVSVFLSFVVVVLDGCASMCVLCLICLDCDFFLRKIDFCIYIYARCVVYIFCLP